jgi:transglutaminase-like putative cysteine protease
MTLDVSGEKRRNCISFLPRYGGQGKIHVLYFAFPGLPPYAEKIVTIEADVMLSESPAPMAAADAGAWLKSEPFVEIDDPVFQRHAPALGGTSAVSKAQVIYQQWVSQNVKDAGYSAKDRGALYALTNKKGDCTEFMYLFVALCRLQQIPARGLGGYVCTRNAILMPADYHDWAEFYDGARWQTVDPQRKVFMRDASQYVATRIIGKAGPMENFARFRFKGEGLKVTMNQR